MGKTWILMVTCAIMLSGMEAFACTGLLVGKKASVDGSVMISSLYRTEVSGHSLPTVP